METTLGTSTTIPTTAEAIRAKLRDMLEGAKNIEYARKMGHWTAAESVEEGVCGPRNELDDEGRDLFDEIVGLICEFSDKEHAEDAIANLILALWEAEGGDAAHHVEPAQRLEIDVVATEGHVTADDYDVDPKLDPKLAELHNALVDRLIAVKNGRDISEFDEYQISPNWVYYTFDVEVEEPARLIVEARTGYDDQEWADNTPAGHYVYFGHDEDSDDDTAPDESQIGFERDEEGRLSFYTISENADDVRLCRELTAREYESTQYLFEDLDLNGLRFEEHGERFDVWPIDNQVDEVPEGARHVWDLFDADAGRNDDSMVLFSW